MISTGKCPLLAVELCTTVDGPGILVVVIPEPTPPCNTQEPVTKVLSSYRLSRLPVWHIAGGPKR